MKTLKEKINGTFDSLKGKFSYKNTMQSPKVQKIILSVGVGSIKDKKRVELIEDRLKKITGQKPSPRGAKKSIAAFKLREGEVVGFQVTLRGRRMESFLDKLLNIALPRSKDFKGLSDKGIDEMGNFTLGINEHTIFPETSDEDIKDVFGMAVTVVTGASDKEEAKALLSHLGFPFKENK